MAKHLVQILIQTGTLVGRAFAKALRQEIRYSQEAAKRSGGGEAGQKSAQADLYHSISLQEAKQILNVKDIDDLESIKKNYDHLFKVNDKKSGGSFYLQSKVFRAKERLEQEMYDQHNKGSGGTSPPSQEESQQPRSEKGSPS